MHTRISRAPAVVAVVAWIACWGCETKSMLQKGATGKETSLADLQEKAVDVGVAWGPASANNSTRVGFVDLMLNFADVAKMEGDACPIVHASATFGGVTLNPSFQGGTTGCGLYDDPDCGQMCLGVDWDPGDITALLETSPETVDLVLEDASEMAVVTVRNPAPMATVTVLDLVEGQEVHYGDSFHVQLQPQPPATIEDVQTGFSVTMSEAGGGLPAFPDVASGSNPWEVDIVPPDLPAGPLTLHFGCYIQRFHFDSCPSDFTCSGGAGVEFGQFALQYSP